MILGCERHDFADVENDRPEWKCSGCHRQFGINDCGPQLQIDDPVTNSTLLFCGLCVEDRRFPQPVDEIIIADCPECEFPLNNADRILVNTGVKDVCCYCEAKHAHAENLWRAQWNRLWLQSAAVWIGVCAIAGIVAAVLR